MCNHMNCVKVLLFIVQLVCKSLHNSYEFGGLSDTLYNTIMLCESLWNVTDPSVEN